MPRSRHTRDDIEAGLSLSLLPFATLGQTRIALEFYTALTIDAQPFECGRVLQDKNNYCFGY
jgi:hypothetical protein